jgi:hypothetical protein
MMMMIITDLNNHKDLRSFSPNPQTLVPSPFFVKGL